MHKMVSMIRVEVRTMPVPSCATTNAFGAISANSAKFRGIRPRMYTEDLL